MDVEIGYHVDDVWIIENERLKMLDAGMKHIEHFCRTSRLQGEPAAGMNDKVVHPAEPFEMRITLTARF